MSTGRVAGWGMSLPLAVGFLMATSLWLTSAGCGSSGHPHFGQGDAGSGVDSGQMMMGPVDGGADQGLPPSDGGGSGDSSSGEKTDACVTAVTGSVGPTGGTVSRLVFAVVGDTRPANEDDVSGYPTSIISTIFNDIQALNPQPVLVVGTGDYQFASTGSYNTSYDQLNNYMMARGAYSGAFFPAMGNHECGVSGPYSTSDNNNCGPGNPGGATPNYNHFMSQMLAPISVTTPYYSVNVNATDGSWTAKFVMTAANAWDSAQQAWLTTTMSQPTTYTFVARHEPSDAYPPLPPGVAGVDAVLAMYPYTLLLTGHSHTYGHWSDAPQTVVIGNGGAPLSSKDYGFGLFSQRCDGAIVADEIDYMTGAADPTFHFVVTPSGSITH